MSYRLIDSYLICKMNLKVLKFVLYSEDFSLKFNTSNDINWKLEYMDPPLFYTQQD